MKLRKKNIEVKRKKEIQLSSYNCEFNTRNNKRHTTGIDSGPPQ